MCWLPALEKLRKKETFTYDTFARLYFPNIHWTGISGLVMHQIKNDVV